MGDSFLKSTVQGRIAAVLVGLLAGFLAKKYGYDIGIDNQELATSVTSEIIGSIGAWITTAGALFLAGRSKMKEKEK